MKLVNILNTSLENLFTLEIYELDSNKTISRRIADVLITYDKFL